jgi:transcriptional regulator GlxA family with amidase domain
LEPLPQAFGATTWVVVVGQPTEHLSLVTPAVTLTARWLHEHLGETLNGRARDHRLVTICSGTLLAARAGLLGGRRCTTHHECLPALRVLAPQATVVENRVIAEECGEALAASVAADMVVYLRRSDRDPEQSPFGIHRGHLHATVHRVQDAILDEPERDWNMAALAHAGHTTERHLLRLFIEQAGVSPLQYLQAIRLERARQALEHGSSVTHAAEVAGFRSGLQMRRAWARLWGGSPSDVLKAHRG